MRLVCWVVMAILAASGASAAYAQQHGSGCFWTYPRDLPLVETEVRYWRGDFHLARGEWIEVAGEFPHARQTGFNIHRRSDNAVIANMPDTAITADPGSINPFIGGADRGSARRSFRFLIAGGAGRSGVVGLGDVVGDHGFDGRILYRLYLPDRATPGGGVLLPRVTRIGADGRRYPQGSACPDPATVDPGQPLGATNIPPVAGTVAEPLDWRSSGTPKGDASGDLMVNRDNAYAYALTDFSRGPVLVLHGRAPTHPATLWGDAVMKRGAQVRYWSICSYRHPSDRGAACVPDELVPLDLAGDYTIVVSTPANRPSNARETCGVAWIDAKTDSEGVLLLRYVRPDREFHNIPGGNVAGAPAATMLGRYLPVGNYIDVSAFERRGC